MGTLKVLEPPFVFSIHPSSSNELLERIDGYLNASVVELLDSL